MKIAIVRGPSLNKFEMQYYEPLAQRHEIVCFTSTRPVYDISGIDLPMVQLSCWGQVLEFIPGAISGLYWAFGDPQGLIGLENKLAGFQIAHTAELFSFYTHQALMAKKEGRVRKVVATVSENIPFNQEWYPRQKRLKKFALSNLDHILAISNSSKRALIREGYPEKKITVVPHGINLKQFKPGRKEEKLARRLGLKKSQTVILSVGRFVREKGFEDLLFAAKTIKQNKQLHHWQLLLVGEGPEKKNLKKLCQQLGLANQVIFHSGFPYKEMPKIYRLADIFVLASKPTPIWQEQFAMVLIEAMASGLPVVATRSGAIPEVVAKTGLLVPPGDWQQLADSIERLLKDNKLKKELGIAGLKRAIKNYDCQKIARKIEKVYQKTLKGN